MSLQSCSTAKALQTTMAYFAAKRIVLDAGFEEEVDYHEDLKFENVDVTTFLRECAWVILSSGMRESVVNKVFPRVSAIFGDFGDATYIVRKANACRREALKVFNHLGKLNAIIELASEVKTSGFAAVQRRIREEGVSYLREFSYLGPATSLHLAKNLGLDVVKPDRHLIRISLSLGYKCPTSLCSDIHRISGERVAVVDVVLWRFATIRTDYLQRLGAKCEL